MQIITNRFSAVVSAVPQDSADMCLLSSSESVVVPIDKAWADTKREINIILRVVYLLMTYKLYALSTTLFPVCGFEEHPTKTMIAY